MLPLMLGVASFFVVIAFALAAVLTKAIDGRGFLASVAVGFAIIYGAGVSWFFIVAVFFALGVIVTWYKYGYKKKLGSAQEKGGARSWPNILANGGMASAVSIMQFFWPSHFMAALFLGAISTAAADTAATELGLLSRGPPVLVTNPTRSVPPGTSGGVSGFGYAGAAAASLVIGGIAVGLEVGGKSPLIAVVCLLGGLCGSTADSLLGATVQRQGFCTVCHRQTEALMHCGEHTTATRGIPFLENNVVNFISTAVGGAVAVLAVLVLGL